MAHPCFSGLVEELRVRGLTGQCLHGQGSDELCRASREDDFNGRSLLFQQPHELCTFIGRNPA